MKFKVILFILCILCTQIQAGSVLSSEGVGLPLASVDGQSMGMGGVSIAVPDPFHLSSANPAGLHTIDLSRFTIHYLYESNTFQTNQGSAKYPYSNFEGFIFGVPVTSNSALAFGLKPYSRVDYKTSLSNQINDIAYDQIITGSGGLNTIDLSGSFKFMKNLAAGITGHFYFGRIEKNWLIDFSGTQHYTTKDTYATRASGAGFTLGLHYQPMPDLTIGAVWTPSAKLNTKTFLDYKAIEDNSEVTYIHYRDTLTSNIRIPASIGFGLGWRINTKWKIGSDLVFTDWDEMKIDNQSCNKLHSVIQSAVGIEYIVTQNPYAPFFKKCIYRTGFSYTPFYTTDISDQAIHEWHLTTGIGIPIWNNSSRANIAFSYGKRGSLDTNGLSETLFRIILSLDAGEKWFLRRR